MTDPDDDFDDGWDNHAVLVEGRWVDRSPRYPDREPQLRREVELLPWLAPLLPLPVPRPRIVSADPMTVRHALLPGIRCPGVSPAHGAAIGRFLRALHSLDPEEAVRHGSRPAEETHAVVLSTLDRMREDVLPLLPEHVAQAGASLLERMTQPPPDPRLVHGDLGLDHVRVTGDAVTGVIDWGDSCIGDAALDLSATTLSSSPAFAQAVASAYGPDDALLARAKDWHQLGPWHEVLYGLGSGGPAFVESGLAGTVTRLERFGST